MTSDYSEASFDLTDPLKLSQGIPEVQRADVETLCPRVNLLKLVRLRPGGQAEALRDPDLIPGNRHMTHTHTSTPHTQYKQT